jgi:hypothetical protein
MAFAFGMVLDFHSGAAASLRNRSRNMIINAIIAVALGVSPVSESDFPQLVRVDDRVAARIGKYEQFTDKKGNTHVRGYDRLGRAYDLTIDRQGQVTGQAGMWEVSFSAADAR